MLRRAQLLGDGAAWIWNLADERFDARIEVVDHCHAAQHLDAEKTVAQRWVHLNDILARELGGAGLWIDSSALSAGQTVDRVVRERENAEL